MSIAYCNENLVSLVEDNHRQCPICKKDYEIDDIIVSTPCNHIFHKNCIVNSLRQTPSCPKCGKACRQMKLKSYNILTDTEQQTADIQIPAGSNQKTSTGAIPKASAGNRITKGNL